MRNWMFPINICNWFWLPSFAFLPAMVIQIWPWLIQCYRSSFKSDNQNILVWLYTLIFTMLNFIWIFVFFVFFSSFFRFFSSFQFVSFFPTFFLFWKPLFTACFKNQINLHETLCRKRTCLFTIYFHFLWWLNMRAHQN